MKGQDRPELPPSPLARQVDWLPNEEAGQILQAAREHAGLTQQQLAERVGVDPAYIGELESGVQHAGRTEHFHRIAHAIDMHHEDVEVLNPPVAHYYRTGRPAALLELVEDLGDKYPELRDPDFMYWLSGFRERGVNPYSRTREGWEAMFHSVRKFWLRRDW